jgi:hypothetical protein
MEAFMAGIKADGKQFWQGFLAALKAGMPARTDGKDYSNKEIESHYDGRLRTVNNLFGLKGRNYQDKWTDDEMGAFNAGEPTPETRKVLLAAIMWGSKVSSRCRSLSMNRGEFEAAVMASFDPGLSDLDNWCRGCETAERMAAERFSGDFAKDVKKGVAAYAAHFTGKLTNSNVTTGAVLALPDASPHPYLYAGSIGELPLDCWSNSSPGAAGYRQMLNCSRRVRKEECEAVTIQDAAIASAFDEAVANLGSGEDRPMNRSVDWRLRQIVLPKDGGYVALTPLSAAGISEHIFSHERDLSGYEISMPIGGSKPENATSIYSATRALVREVPSVSHGGISVYLRLLKRGYSVTIKKPLRDALDHYCRWVSANTFTDGRNSFKARQVEINSSGIYRVVHWVMDDIQDISNDVTEYLDSLEPDDRQKKTDALTEKGRIEAALVTGRFSQDFIDAIVPKIVDMVERHEYAPEEGSRKMAFIAFEREDHERRLAIVGEIVSKFIVKGV